MIRNRLLPGMLQKGRFGLASIMVPLILYYLLRALTLFNKRIRIVLPCSNFYEYVGWRLVRWIPVVGNFRGFKFLLKLGELRMVSLGCLDDGYEKHEIEYLCNLEKSIGRLRVAVDVGAHVGTYTLPLSSIADKVIVIEPLEEARNVLFRNLRLNKITNVQIIPYAASSLRGEVIFLVKKWGGSRIHDSKNSINSHHHRKIRTLRIDDLRIDCVDFLKIDVEGHEIHVLKGAKETLIRCRPLILLEVWHENYEEVKAFLNEVGYKLVDKGFYDWVNAKNFLAIPTEDLNKIL